MNRKWTQPFFIRDGSSQNRAVLSTVAVKAAESPTHKVHQVEVSDDILRLPDDEFAKAIFGHTVKAENGRASLQRAKG